MIGEPGGHVPGAMVVVVVVVAGVDVDAERTTVTAETTVIITKPAMIAGRQCCHHVREPGSAPIGASSAGKSA